MKGSIKLSISGQSESLPSVRSWARCLQLFQQAKPISFIIYYSPSLSLERPRPFYSCCLRMTRSVNSCSGWGWHQFSRSKRTCGRLITIPDVIGERKQMTFLHNSGDCWIAQPKSLEHFYLSHSKRTSYFSLLETGFVNGFKVSHPETIAASGMHHSTIWWLKIRDKCNKKPREENV